MKPAKVVPCLHTEFTETFQYDEETSDGVTIERTPVGSLILLRGPLDVWRVSEHDGEPPFAVMLHSGSARALIMKRPDGEPSTPDVSEVAT